MRIFLNICDQLINGKTKCCTPIDRLCGVLAALVSACSIIGQSRPRKLGTFLDKASMFVMVDLLAR
jgi:hypothetical protein